MAASRSEARAGFTLVELLVVIAIIAILVSLLLPAVNSAREAARRVQCQNNIRNLTLAVLNYESARGKLPASNSALQFGSLSLLYNGNEESPNNQMSFLVRVLPFLEEQAIFDQVDFNVSVVDQDLTNVGQPWFANDLSIAQCPSDAAGGRFYRSDRFTPNVPAGTGYAKGNYAAYAGPEHISCQRVFTGALIYKDQSIGKVKDGASKTVALAEVRTRDKETDQRGAWALAWPAATVLALDQHSSALPGTAGCDRFTPTTTRYIPKESVFYQAQPPNNPVGAWNSDQLRECDATDQFESDILNMPCDRESFLSAAPRSLHTGGVNTSNLDGSVRFIVDDIDVGLFATLICINDGLTYAASLD